MKNRRTINFYPKPRMVLLCKFPKPGESAYAPPEIIKRRPVLVVSKHKREGVTTCTVVPLSLTVPRNVKPWHVKLDSRGMPDRKEGRWAKCDMVTTISVERLQLFACKVHGHVEFKHGTLPSEQYCKVLEGIKAHLKIDWP